MDKDLTMDSDKYFPIELYNIDKPLYYLMFFSKSYYIFLLNNAKMYGNYGKNTYIEKFYLDFNDKEHKVSKVIPIYENIDDLIIVNEVINRSGIPDLNYIGRGKTFSRLSYPII